MICCLPMQACCWIILRANTTCQWPPGLTARHDTNFSRIACLAASTVLSSSRTKAGFRILFDTGGTDATLGRDASLGPAEVMLRINRAAITTASLAVGGRLTPGLAV